MTLLAIIFGSIGTLAETSELQRASFNAAFAEAKLDWHWTPEYYGTLVADGSSGGAARIAAAAARRGTAMDASMVAALHARKSAIFQEKMAAGGLAPLPGVVEVLAKARAAGIKLAMASTTTSENIAALFAATAPTLNIAHFDVVLSGLDAARGKPAPDIYTAALTRLGVTAGQAVAIEDTRQSMAAPMAAGIAALVIPGAIARNQDFGSVTTAPSLSAFGGLGGLAALLAATPDP